MSIELNEGDIVYFFYDQADKNKFAVNLEPISSHKNKQTFNAVIVTSKGLDAIHPSDYLLPEGTLYQESKVVCDQIVSIKKDIILQVAITLDANDLREIRKKAAKSIGIEYTDTTM